jgi:hypothetical protein
MNALEWLAGVSSVQCLGRLELGHARLNVANCRYEPDASVFTLRESHQHVTRASDFLVVVGGSSLNQACHSLAHRVGFDC